MSLCAEPGVTASGAVSVCFVILPADDGPNGRRAGGPYRDADGIVVFLSRDEAEAFLDAGDLRGGWRVGESSGGEVISLHLAFGG